MPTLSSTASSTTPIASISPATACDASVPNRRIDHTPDTRQKPTPAGRLKRATSCRNTGRHDLGMTGRLRRNQHHSIEFKRQVAQEFMAGETLHGLAKRHDLSRNLIRVWVAKYEAGAYDEDARAADLLQEYEAKIAALERLVGRQALEIEFLKGASRNALRARSATTSVITGPVASPSPKDAV